MGGGRLRVFFAELAVSAVNHFVLMRRVYEPRFGALRAHQIGMTTRIAYIFVFAYVFVDNVPSHTDVRGSFRPFTIASAPDDEFVQLATRLHEGSGIKRALSRLVPGEHARLLGPVGSIAPADAKCPIVYVAQGIGITPARSMIRAGQDRRQTLIHIGAPYFRDELEPRVTVSHYPQDRAAFDAILAQTAASESDARFVVAGSTAFTTASSRTLRARGVAKHRISADGFIGLPSS